MGKSLFRRDPPKETPFTTVIGERKNLKKQRTLKFGTSILSRDPAYVYVTGKCNKCGKGNGAEYTVPKDEKTWNSTYGPNKFKPSPILQRLTIEYGGDWGLAQKISGTIQAFKEEDFKLVVDHILLPGNKITVKFGYGAGNNKWQNKSQKEITLSGYRVATFGFNSADQGSWICNFTAVSSATALKSVDMLNVVGTGALKYKVASVHDAQDTATVRSIIELIEFDSQRNGMYASNQLKNGDVINHSVFANYAPGSVKNKNAAVVIYDGEHILGTTTAPSSIFSFMNRGLPRSEDPKDSTFQVYVTLGYVVNRIFNDQLLKKVVRAVAGGSTDKTDFEKLKITFHDEYSKAKIPNQLRSGNPLEVLLLGNKKGNYKGNNGGKDFEAELTSPNDVTCLSGDGIVSLDKILINKTLIHSALSIATKQEDAQADSTGVKNTKEVVISMTDFFEKLFAGINDATGGALALRLVEDVDDKFRNTLIVVDQNTGGDDTLACLLLNPIDGDGSTRTCEIQSNVGSEEYRASMFVGNSKKGDPVAGMRECDSDLNLTRELEYASANLDAIELLYFPGELGKSKFDGKHIDALKSLMSNLYKNRPEAWGDETCHWPGMRINATIDGTWGIIPGCAISTTQLPSTWRKKGLYFMVTGVTHNFENSDWSTTIDGIMSYYKKISYY